MKSKDKPKEKKIDVFAPQKEETKKEETAAPDLSVLLAWKNYAKEAARKKHWEYFVIDQFLRGNQSIRGNPNDNSIEVSKKGESISYPVNKIFSTFRAIRGFVTRHAPKVEVEPENQSEEAKAYARRANKTLERDNQLNNFRKINKEWAYYGVKYGLGYRQVGYDQDKKCAIRWSVDPWDLWKGAPDGEIEDCPYLVKPVRRTIAYLWNKYPDKKSEINPDNELAADEYKKLSLQIINQNEGEQNGLRQEEQTKLAYEIWYRVFDKNKKDGFINKCTITEECILDFEETPFEDYPFIPYKSDIVPNEDSGEGALKHVIAPQRMLNMLNMQVLEYNHVVNKGRFITEKNSGFQVINTTQGQIIRVNPGRKLEAAPVPPMNPIVQWQIEKSNEYIQDIGGQNDASLGRLPSASLSGDAIEALQVGDSNNISDFRDNFEDALALEAAWILKMYSLFENEGVVMTNQIKDEEEETFAVMGQNGKTVKNPDTQESSFLMDNGDYVPAVSILPDNQVKVSVVSQLGETKEARMNLLFKLLDAGVPLKTVLQLLEFPNTDDVMERVASEAMAEVAMAGMQNQVAQPMPGEVPDEALNADMEGMLNG